MSRRLFAAIASLTAGVLLAGPALAGPSVADGGKDPAPPAPDPCSSDIAYQVDARGFFNIGAGTDEQCVPTADAWDLMYSWPSGPGTSFTSVRTDSGTYVLGRDVQPDRVVDHPPGDLDTLSERSYPLPGGVRVTQKLEVDSGLSLDKFDTVRISYEVTNSNDVPVKAEVRVMLDTELDYNDGAPFQVPGYGAVTTETELEGDAVPDYFAAFKDFSDPVHVGAGLLRTPGEITPHRVVFAAWPSIVSTDFDYAVTPGASITRDSAVALYFSGPEVGGEIAPGQTAEFTTRYGRASASIDLRPPLAVSLLAPGEVALNQPFQVTAYLTNIGTADAVNVGVHLYAPDGFDIQDPIRILDHPLAPGQTELLTWQVTAAWDGLLGFQPISLEVRGDNTEKLVTRQVDVIDNDQPDKPYPLIGAHGITGTAADMDDALGEADATVPDLVSSSADTGRVDSVWINGIEIAGEADDMRLTTGADKVNVIAHSKGGLDSRVAMWLDPDAFNALGMLATPNGGSKGADRLCWLRRHHSNAQPQFGACDSDLDGLYDLQTGWMRDVFNTTVRDDPQHLKVVAAGDCTGSGQAKCNAFQPVLGCIRNDTAVCVDSAFARTREYSDGLAHRLWPIFKYDHSQMRTRRCSVRRVLAELYPMESVGNEWLDSGSCGGEDDVWPISAARSSTRYGRSAAARRVTTTAVTASTAAPALADQDATTGVAAPGAPFRQVFDPEGGDEGNVTVLVPGDAGPMDLQVLRPDGTADATAVIDDSDLFGAHQYTVRMSGLAGQSRTVVVGATAPTELGVFTMVDDGGRQVSAAVDPAPDGRATISVRTQGIASGKAAAATVTASWPQDGVQKSVSLTRNSTTGVFTAQVTLPRGSYVPVDVTYGDGVVHRTLMSGAALPSGVASFQGLGASSLVDTDGDGSVDAFRVPVKVQAGEAGAYQVAIDLVKDGHAVTSAPGSAQLTVGAGTLDVDVPLSSLLTADRSGPYQVRNAVLTRGTESREIVASAADLGTTGPLDLGALPVAGVVVGAPSSANLDGDNDGFFDELRFDGHVHVPSGGDYLVMAHLLDPRDRLISAYQDTVTLGSGYQPLSLSFPGELVGANGSGSYALAGLTVTAVDRQDLTGSVHTVWTPELRASDWIGGTPNIANLQELWNAAQAAGAISPFGFFVSEANRLDRVDRAISGGDLVTARRELGTFIDDISGGTRVEPTWRSRVLGYARALQGTLA